MISRPQQARTPPLPLREGLGEGFSPPTPTSPKLFPFLLLTLLLLVAPPANAALLFCNHTKAALEAAFGYREQVDWVSEGWWQIQPGQCARVFNKSLTQRFYFYYARSLAATSANHRAPVWDGKYAFCVDTKAFRATGDGNCEERNLRQQGFHEIDLGPNRHDYTLTFDDGSNR